MWSVFFLWYRSVSVPTGWAGGGGGIWGSHFWKASECGGPESRVSGRLLPWLLPRARNSWERVGLLWWDRSWHTVFQRWDAHFHTHTHRQYLRATLLWKNTHVHKRKVRCNLYTIMLHLISYKSICHITFWTTVYKSVLILVINVSRYVCWWQAVISLYGNV